MFQIQMLSVSTIYSFAFSWRIEPEIGMFGPLTFLNHISNAASTSLCLAFLNHFRAGASSVSFSQGILVLQPRWQCATRNTIFFSNLSLRFHFFVNFVKSLQLCVNSLRLLAIAIFDYWSCLVEVWGREPSLFKQVGQPIQSSQFIIHHNTLWSDKCHLLEA